MQRVSNLHFLSCLESGEKMEAHFITFTHFVRLHWASSAVSTRSSRNSEFYAPFWVILACFCLMVSWDLTFLIWGGEWWWNVFPRLVAELKKSSVTVVLNCCVLLRWECFFGIARLSSVLPCRWTLLWRCSSQPPLPSSQPQPGIQLGKATGRYNRGLRTCPGGPRQSLNSHRHHFVKVF